MDERLNPLFTPWKIGNLEIKNRIVLTSMGGTDLFGWMEVNHFDRDGAKFIMEVAKNNVGLLLPGCQPVYNPMFGQWLHKNKKMYADLAKWMPEFHKTGAKLFVQLTAGFGRSFTVSSMMETLHNNKALRVLSKPVMNLDKITASASPSENRWSDRLSSREMTKEEIQELIDSFAKSAAMLKAAGVDGVEVHAVHEGYLLDQFTLKYVNHPRTNMAVPLKTVTGLPLKSFGPLNGNAARISRSLCATVSCPKPRACGRAHCPAKNTQKSAEIWKNPNARQSICRMQDMTC